MATYPDESLAADALAEAVCRIPDMSVDGNLELPLSIVVVTWNAKAYVEECLQSLVNDKQILTEIVVVDNASSDGTPELVHRQFPEVKLIRNSQNLGFAKANNIGIRAASGTYLALVNSDVVVPPGCLGMLLSFMEAEPTVGIVGPQMIGSNGAVRRSCMRFPSLTNSVCRAVGLDRFPTLSRLVGGQMMAEFSHERIANVEVLNGWFWMIRRAALDQVGLLDERFFIYGEDLDWCHRFRKAGWRLVFNPEARAIHYGGASSSAAPVRFYLEMQRANLQYWNKHHGKTASLINRLVVFFQHVLRLVGHGVTYLVRVSERPALKGKIRRSWAMLAWMLRGHPSLGHEKNSPALAAQQQ
jgi:hypothetical protein